MKIAPVIDAITFSGRIQKKDGENQRERRGGQNPQEKKDESSEENQAETQQNFEASVESFKNDPQTRASGLSVSTQGSGPGLRVILKDQQGAVIRQISGEEFVKLREEVAKSSATRGKILDRKL
jgi:uncharacterized FlaG/YvyC family protein